VQQLFDLGSQSDRNLFTLGTRAGRLAHEGTAPDGGLDQSVGGERFVRQRDRVAVDAELAGERANRRKAGSRIDLATLDLSPQLGGDLLVDRQVRVFGVVEFGKPHCARIRPGQCPVNAGTIEDFFL